MGSIGALAQGSQVASAPATPVLAPIPVDSGTQIIRYTAVVPMANASQAVLFGRASTWFATPQRRSQVYLRVAEPEAGLVVGQVVTDIDMPGLGNLLFQKQLFCTVKLAVKDGRYKYELTDFYFQDYPSAGTPCPGIEPAERFLDASVPFMTPRRMQNHQRQLQLVAQQLTRSIAGAMKEDESW
ncbi:hypothetical protein B0919_06270 [Hymenobacter sp. CRA2]|nr:hypothetical protein B0919_06270 [Hymenobacter sp. CRA2]